MNKESIFHPQSEIRISVLKIDNKKLTKSLLDQIDREWPFDDQLNLTADKVFGFVKIKKPDAPSMRHIVVAEKDGRLLKFDAEKLYSLARMTKQTQYTFLDNNYSKLLKSLFGDDVIKNDYSIEFSVMSIGDLPEDQQSMIFSVVEKVRNFLIELDDHHIFI